MMRIPLKPFFGALLLLFLQACSSDDGTAPREQKYRIVAWRVDGQTLTTYTYAPDGKLLTEVHTNGRSRSYQYNSQGQLVTERIVDPSYQRYRSDYSYDANGKALDRIDVWIDSDAPDIEQKRRTVYTYAGDRIVTVAVNYWNENTNAWHTSGRIVQYTYEAGDRPTKTELVNEGRYWLYTYDAVGNATQIAGFHWRSDDRTMYYKQSEDIYTYDDKKNIFDTTHVPYPQPEGVDANNMVDMSSRYFDEAGNTTSNSNVNFVYEYNAAGYPIKRNTQEFVLEAY